MYPRTNVTGRIMAEKNSGSVAIPSAERGSVDFIDSIDDIRGPSPYRSGSRSIDSPSRFTIECGNSRILAICTFGQLLETYNQEVLTYLENLEKEVGAIDSSDERIAALSNESEIDGLLKLYAESIRMRQKFLRDLMTRVPDGLDQALVAAVLDLSKDRLYQQFRTQYDCAPLEGLRELVVQSINVQEKGDRAALVVNALRKFTLLLVIVAVELAHECGPYRDALSQHRKLLNLICNKYTSHAEAAAKTPWSGVETGAFDLLVAPSLRTLFDCTLTLRELAWDRLNPIRLNKDPSEEAALRVVEDVRLVVFRMLDLSWKTWRESVSCLSEPNLSPTQGADSSRFVPNLALVAWHQQYAEELDDDFSKRVETGARLPATPGDIHEQRDRFWNFIEIWLSAIARREDNVVVEGGELQSGLKFELIDQWGLSPRRQTDAFFGLLASEICRCAKTAGKRLWGQLRLDEAGRRVVAEGPIAVSAPMPDKKNGK